MPAPEKIGIIFVHGIGEQRRFSHLDGEARPLIDALKRRPADVTIEIAAGTHSPLMADQDTWSIQDGAPVRAVVKQGDREQHLFLHEVWWADINERYTFTKEWRFWMWGLAMWWLPFKKVLRLPEIMERPTFPRVAGRPVKGRPFVVRLQLFLISNLFLMGAFSVGAIFFVLKRVFGYDAPNAIRTFVNYLSAVRLYTQTERAGGGFLDAFREPPRVSIRRRMIRTMTDVAKQDYDRWYIFAHSLGSVVAFNGVMENAQALPNYLDEKRWRDLCAAGLAGSANGEFVGPVASMLPARPLWLAENDVVYRDRLLTKFRGLLTYGAPLDKFAMLWPAMVPINVGEQIHFRPAAGATAPANAVPRTPEWINIYEPTDPVGAALDAYGAPGARPGVPAPKNYGYRADMRLLISHLKYLCLQKGNTNELPDAAMDWVLGGGDFTPRRPEDKPWFPPYLCVHKQRMVFRLIQYLIVYFLLTLLGTISIPVILGILADVGRKARQYIPDLFDMPRPIVSLWTAFAGGMVWLWEGYVAAIDCAVAGVKHVLGRLPIPNAVVNFLLNPVAARLVVGVAVVTLIAGIVGRAFVFDKPDPDPDPDPVPGPAADSGSGRGIRTPSMVPP